jgi:hypothetical protein
LPIQNKFGRIVFRIVFISQYLTVNYCMYGGELLDTHNYSEEEQKRLIGKFHNTRQEVSSCYSDRKDITPRHQ